MVWLLQRATTISPSRRSRLLYPVFALSRILSSNSGLQSGGLLCVPQQRTPSCCCSSSSSYPVRFFRGGAHTKTYILGIGSNLGDRYLNIVDALQLLSAPSEQDDCCSIPQCSFLYETPPMYLTDQPPFLNAVVSIATEMEPLDLLRRLKSIEEELGRDLNAVRNGPRPIDLDILLQQDDDNETESYNSDTLTIPHPRINERAFVLAPLMDVLGPNFCLPKQQHNQSLLDMWKQLSDRDTIVRVVPLPRNRFLRWNETLIMGVLNMTPDSFSDGNNNRTTQEAVQRCLEMERAGAHVVDIGGESTRPGAKEVDIEEELRRTIPVIEGIRQVSNMVISIDTRHSVVAEKAVQAGADIVNDVSGGQFDDEMLPTVAKLGVPMVLMHMRGTPETMQGMTKYNQVVEEVGKSLLERSEAAECHGVHRWLQIVDPGIGFAKDMSGNLELLRGLAQIRSHCKHLPLLLGTSRKGFLGKITGIEVPDQRDPATMASCVAALTLAGRGPAMVRVHNVPDCQQAMSVLDAIMK